MTSESCAVMKASGTAADSSHDNDGGTRATACS
jgi:hypothetical protein